MNTTADRAEAVFREGFNCSQSVLACCGEAYGLPRRTAVQVAQAFGGGMGRTGNVCGAVTGALMVVGLKCSAKDGQDAQAKQEAHRLAREFLSRFQARHGSLLCRDLLGCDIGTEEGMQQVREKDLHRKVCAPLVKDAAGIIGDVLGGKEDKT